MVTQMALSIHNFQESEGLINPSVSHQVTRDLLVSAMIDSYNGSQDITEQDLFSNLTWHDLDSSALLGALTVSLGIETDAVKIHLNQSASSRIEIQTLPLEESRPAKFGTSGDRGIIGEDFDSPLIHKLAQGTALYGLESYPKRATLMGHDTRTNNPHYIREAAAIHAANGIQVILVDGPIPTPVLAFLASGNTQIGGVINLTASHSPHTDGGFKFSPEHGGAADQGTTDRITELSNGHQHGRFPHR